jgi:periplasmic protein TonB
MRTPEPVRTAGRTVTRAAARPIPAARALALAVLATAAVLAAPAAKAQFSMVPAPTCKEPVASQQDVEREFRIDASRHLYSCFPMRVYRGKLPPLLYGVMMVEVELDAQGNVVDVGVIRRPAADEVGPWVVAMIKKASPFPAPAKLAAAGNVKFMETYFVDKSGLFQTHTLTEGQRNR